MKMDKYLVKIIERIIQKMSNDDCDIITIKHIHNNSFGLVVEYYSLNRGRNYTLKLSDILEVLELGITKLGTEND